MSQSYDFVLSFTGALVTRTHIQFPSSLPIFPKGLKTPHQTEPSMPIRKGQILKLGTLCAILGPSIYPKALYLQT